MLSCLLVVIIILGECVRSFTPGELTDTLFAGVVLAFDFGALLVTIGGISIKVESFLVGTLLLLRILPDLSVGSSDNSTLFDALLLLADLLGDFRLDEF